MGVRLGAVEALGLTDAGPPRGATTGPRALARTAAELPGRFAIDGVETAALLRGSARYRTLLL